jgi:Rad3-related DNA helicase
MHEGIDLFGDLSRLQIVCKIPYPNHHEDRQLSRRMELDNDYYNYLTALKLCQSVGRSVRSQEDWAHTYIIDGGLQNFLNRANWLLPQWFIEAIQWQ